MAAGCAVSSGMSRGGAVDGAASCGAALASAVGASYDGESMTARDAAPRTGRSDGSGAGARDDADPGPRPASGANLALPFAALTAGVWAPLTPLRADAIATTAFGVAAFALAGLAASRVRMSLACAWVVLAGGATVLAVGRHEGWSEVLDGAMFGLWLELPALLAFGLVLAAGNVVGRARTGSLVDRSDRRRVWTAVAGLLACPCLVVGGRTLPIAIAAALACVALLAADLTAASRVTQEDTGVGDARRPAPADTYRSSGQTLSGDMDAARFELRESIRWNALAVGLGVLAIVRGALG